MNANKKYTITVAGTGDGDIIGTTEKKHSEIKTFCRLGLIIFHDFLRNKD